jgi:hypothetical protein
MDGCCDHREMIADEELHRHAAWNLDQADALLWASGPRADVVRGAIEARRLEARVPPGARLGRGGDAVRAEKVAVGVSTFGVFLLRGSGIIEA